MAKRQRFGFWSWEDVSVARKDALVALLPLGTIEQHGPHLPLDTDTQIAHAIASHTAALLPETVVLLPPLPYGVSMFHTDPPGGILIPPHTYEKFVIAIIESMIDHGFRMFFLLNGHGGNSSSVTNVQKIVNDRHREKDVCVGTTQLYLSGDAGRAALKDVGFAGGVRHADEIETSIMLATNPKSVRREKIADDLGRIRGNNFHPFDDGPLALYLSTDTESMSGVCGEPSKATAEIGRELLLAAAKEIADYIQEMVGVVKQIRCQLRRAPGTR